ncbi:LOLA1 protein, partial [Acromyrmex heyeri]
MGALLSLLRSDLKQQPQQPSTKKGYRARAVSTREVVFPDSFEVLPQPHDLSVVFMTGVSHEQQRKFRCRFCGKGYRWKSTMRRHEMVECGGKPPAFQCPECPYKARQRGNLTVHFKRHHQKIGYDEGSSAS